MKAVPAAVLAQLLAIGVPPEVARREVEAMQPLVITLPPYANRLSLQANLKDYAWVAEIFLMERGDSLEMINARLADRLLGINGKLEYPREFALKRLTVLAWGARRCAVACRKTSASARMKQTRVDPICDTNYNGVSQIPNRPRSPP